MKKRITVMSRRSYDLTPLQVAIDEMKSRVEELDGASVFNIAAAGSSKSVLISKEEFVYFSQVLTLPQVVKQFRSRYTCFSSAVEFGIYFPNLMVNFSISTFDELDPAAEIYIGSDEREFDQWSLKRRQKLHPRIAEITSLFLV